MGTTTTALLTFEEFERLPEYPGKQELLEGELIELPPAELNHNQIAHLILFLLHKALKEAHDRQELRTTGITRNRSGR